MKNKKDFIEENKEVEIFDTLNVVNVSIKESDLDFSGGKKSLPTHNANPYREDLLMSVKYGNKTVYTKGNDKQLYDSDGNTVPYKNVILKTEVIDKDKFVKVYVENIGQMFNLPKYAEKLFLYILRNLGQQTDSIYLFPKDVVEDCGWSNTNQLDKALIILCRRKILAKSYRTYWWYINPTILFNGDRVAFIRLIRTEDDAVWKQGKMNLGNGED